MQEPDALAGVTPLPTDSAVAPPKAGPGMLKLSAAGLLIALVAGAAGAAISAGAFPAKNGKVGPAGIAGAQGPEGPAGPAGSSAAAQVVDTNKLGYCFDTTSQNSNASGSYVYWITNVLLNAPTDNNGTLSCPNGTFISLTPVGPTGTPIANYVATKASS